MNRQECEKLIAGKLWEIIDIYHEYNPDGNYLSLSYMNEDDDQYIRFNNEMWSAQDGEPAGPDYDHPIYFSCRKEDA